MYFPAFGCYNSKHLNINVFAPIVFQIPEKWTIVFQTLLFAYIHADMSIVEFRKFCSFFIGSEKTQVLCL
jgi:hypothetical protein